MTDWYVSTGGASGNPGTLGSPWEFASARTRAEVMPGDTVWLRGGSYDFNQTNCNWGRSGLLGTGADNRDNKVVYRGYRSDVNDPTTLERVRIRAITITTAPTSGATTCAATGAGSATLNVAKAAGVNQVVIAGHQITVASGPGAGVYVITSGTTIVQGATTAVAVTPNVRGTVAGGEVVTLNLTPLYADLCVMQSAGAVPASFIWLQELELEAVMTLRTVQIGGPALWSHFAITNDGNKLLDCICHDTTGAQNFIDANNGDIEMYGNLYYNVGYALADGGGHHQYIHHDGSLAKFCSSEANCMFGDHGVAMQMYDAVGAAGKVKNIEFLRNIIFLSGMLNDQPNIGGKDALALVMGGPQPIFNQKLRENLVYWPDNIGDRFVSVGEAGQLIGAGIEVESNYFHGGGGAGFGGIQVPALVDDGTVTAGATTVNGVNGAGSLTVSVAKAAGANQQVYAGDVLTVASGAGAGSYPIANSATLVAGGNTVVSLLIGLTGATSDGETVTLALNGGKLRVRSNTVRVNAPDATHNGHLIHLAENGNVAKPGRYDWGNNSYHRAPGVAGGDCGSELPTRVPTAFADTVSVCRTQAQFLTDCGVTDNAVTGDPTETITFVKRADRYQPGKAWLAYLNYASLSTIVVPDAQLREVLHVGDVYVVHDVRDVWAGVGGEAGTPIIGPVRYDGKGISLPTTQLAHPTISGGQPGIGHELAPPDTAPFFNTFLLRRKSRDRGASPGSVAMAQRAA